MNFHFLLLLILILSPMVHSCLILGPLCEIIEGTVEILANMTEEFLEGIEDLVEVTEDLIISEINSAELIFKNLTKIGGNLVISGSANLTTLNLESLVSVGGVIIQDNPKLFSVALGLLKNVSGDLIISNNPLLYSLGDISSLDFITGDLTIQDMQLSDLTFFSNLAVINASLTINNTGVLDFGGLSNLMSIGQDLRIINNLNLSNIDGLSSLISELNEIQIIDNPLLNSLEGLLNVEGVANFFLQTINSGTTFFCSDSFKVISSKYSLNEPCFCLPNYFGKDCILCNCENGHCDDGIDGNGNCTCPDRFDGETCSNCIKGYSGADCDTCSDGFAGIDCSECSPGYFGTDCTTCDCVHGSCDDGIFGNGFCTCNDEYTGDDCSTIETCTGDCVKTEQTCDCSEDALENYLNKTGDKVYITGKHTIEVDIVLEIIDVSLDESEIVVHGSLSLKKMNMTIDNSLFRIDQCVSVNDVIFNINASDTDISNGSLTLVFQDCPSGTAGDNIMGAVDFIINGENSDCAQFEYSKTQLNVIFNTGCKEDSLEDIDYFPIIITASIIVASIIVVLLLIAFVKPLNKIVFPYRNRSATVK